MNQFIRCPDIAASLRCYDSSMFRDLRTRVTPGRRMLAWVLFGLLLLAITLYFTLDDRSHPGLRRVCLVALDSAAAILAIRLLSYFVLDPLFSERRTATPGFARDLIVVSLYVLSCWFILRDVMGVSVGQLLGTGAIAAAVIGLSLQETLGNLFAGVAMHLDPVFRVGDWIEVSGNLRGGPGRESFVGEVVSITWRTVQLRTENGDTDIFPNRAIAQAVVTNLYAPSGLHRRTAKVIVEPHSELHVAVEKLSVALAGIPHYSHHRPEVVVWGFDLGGAVLEMRWWALGFRHGRSGNFLAMRLANTVLPREGFCLLGPHGATTTPVESRALSDKVLKDLLRKMGIPLDELGDFRNLVTLRRVAPEEGLIREGDSGDSLFYVLSGHLQVVRPVEQTEPYTGIFWDCVGEIGAGEWFGEASVLTGAPRNATVVAGTSCDLVEVPKCVFERLIAKEPQIMERLADLMDTRNNFGDRGREPISNGRDHWLKQIRRWFEL